MAFRKKIVSGRASSQKSASSKQSNERFGSRKTENGTTGKENHQ